jgi:hypothetical protein
VLPEHRVGLAGSVDDGSVGDQADLREGFIPRRPVDPLVTLPLPAQRKPHAGRLDHDRRARLDLLTTRPLPFLHPRSEEAAIVASQLPGGARITSLYAPDFLLEGGKLEVPDDLPALAAQALDRIVGDDSEWRELWEESGTYRSGLAELQQIQAVVRAVLTDR